MAPRAALRIPDPSLVLLVGASGCGKSTFARRHFAEPEIVSSDAFRRLVANDAADQTASAAAFEVLHLVVDKRLARPLLTVVDATNLRADARRPLLALARRHHLPAVAVVLDVEPELCVARAGMRADRVVEEEIVRRHLAQLDDARDRLPREGLARVLTLHGSADVEMATVAREPLPADRRGDPGPFDLIGDVHGCADELEALLAALGYASDEAGTYRHPAGRKAVFLGDLADRGPRVPDTFRVAMAMCAAGSALCLPGNHDDKLRRALEGRPVTVAHGLRASLAQLEREPPALREEIAAFVRALPSHLVLDGGTLVAAHAGMPAALQGRESKRVRDFALYGAATGRTDESGIPERLDWAASYRGHARVVYGHTPVAAPAWVNGTLNVDTGCVFGGRLTALRYPELELVQVPARGAYAVPRRPFRRHGAAAPSPAEPPPGGADEAFPP